MKKLSVIFILFISLLLVSCGTLSSSDSLSGETTTNSSSSTDTTTSSSSDSTSSNTSSSSDSSTNTSDTSGEDSSTDEYADLVKSDVYQGDYYDSIDTTDSSSLKTELNSLISDATVLSYSEDKAALKTTDCYDENYVECIYTGQRIEPDNISSSSGSWNREHVWAKTYGFNDESYTAYTDINHLRVSEASINTKRNDSYFGEVSDSSASTDNYGNTWTSDVFEPRDEVKGDIARILMYMTVRYNDSTLDLELTDSTTDINNSQGQLGGDAYIGILSTLLQWAANDPVDSRELARNNAVYSIQGNRNPFIDHPEYAYYMYEDECSDLGLTYDDFYDDDTYVSYNSAAIAEVDHLIESIGTVSLDSSDLIDEAEEAYNSLGSDSKSFETEYITLEEDIDEYDILEDAANQDTAQSAKFDFLGLTSKTGTKTSNGIALDYSAAYVYSTKGIYAETSKEIELDATNLYDSIKSLTLTMYGNKGQWESVITISDGTNFVSSTETMATSSKDYTFDISSLNLSDEITITITDESQKSVVLSQLVFEV